MLLPRIWISAIMLYNVICGILSIINPSILEVLFPGSATLFGTKSTMFSRVLGSYALSIAGIRGIFVIRPTWKAVLEIIRRWELITIIIFFGEKFHYESLLTNQSNNKTNSGMPYKCFNIENKFISLKLLQSYFDIGSYFECYRNF